MFRSVLLFASIAIASPALAESAHVTGTQDGVSFDYVSELAPDGGLVLHGTYLNPHEQFVLKVFRNGHVEGQVGVTPVSFDVSRKVRDQAMAGLTTAAAPQLADAVPVR